MSARRTWPRSPRVLLVDDSVVVRRVLDATLRQLPEFIYATIDEASNGVLAMRRLQEGPAYDLVLSDIRMPYMDGLELVTRIRTELKATMPVILISTLGTAEDLRRGREAGATGYICKPIAPHHIMRELQEILDLSRRH